MVLDFFKLELTLMQIPSQMSHCSWQIICLLIAWTFCYLVFTSQWTPALEGRPFGRTHTNTHTPQLCAEPINI